MKKLIWMGIIPEKENNHYDYKLSNNISRSKSKLIEYALCNQFEYFLTGTINSKKFNRYDLSQYYKALSKFFNNYKSRRNIEFAYIIVPEKHKDGAIHIHGFVKGINPEDVFINANGYLEWRSYSEKFGFMSMSRIKNRVHCAYYCTKYITKEAGDVVGKGKQLFWCSKGLKKAEVEYLYDVDPTTIDWDYKNDYAYIKTVSDLEELEQYITFLESGVA